MSNDALNAETPLKAPKSTITENTQLQIGSRKSILSMNTEIQTGTNSKIAIYLRCSSDEQNVDSQMLFVEGLVQRHGFKVEECKIYKDEGVSATKMKELQDRPQGLQLIQDIQAGKITHLFAYRIDRLFRNLQGGAAFIESMKTNYPNVSIITTDCPMALTDPDGEFFFGMQVLFARREAAVLAQRTQGGMQAKQEALGVTSKAVYGWDVCHKPSGEKTMRPNWKEQAVLDWFESEHAKGTAYAAMARQLTKWGVRTKSGSNWQSAGVRRHFTNRAKLHDQLHQFTKPNKMSKPPFRTLSVTQK